MKKLALLLISAATFTACTSPTLNKEQNETEKQDSLNRVQQQEQEKEKNKELEKYLEIGFNYAVSTKKTLGKNLTGAIMEGGTQHALEFCNVQAMPLTDSMSQVHNAKITRVSDQPRNPNNAANDTELAQIKHYKNLVAEGKKGKEIQPHVEMEGNQVHFYYPIITNEMCLQCHGTKNEQIQPETLAMLAELYPEDQATGYSDNEVRGIWSIIFEK